MQYPINEMFQTLQGEGYFTGVPAIFIRLQGCPVGLLPVLPVSRQKRPEAVLAVRTIMPLC